MLQLYGEKVEEAEELKLDLQDVKEMYKAQIDDLLRQQQTSKVWFFCGDPQTSGLKDFCDVWPLVYLLFFIIFVLFQE